jgi:hypothetical protein
MIVLKIIVKLLIKLLGVLAVLLIIALIAALFVSKDLKVTKEIVVNKPKNEVFNYIKELKNQDNYSVWNKMDTAMQHTYTGTDGTVGFVSAWKGNSKVGTGEQTITKIVEGERLETDLVFKELFENKAQALMTTTALDSMSTKVTWGFDSKMPYPFNLMKVLMSMEKELGKDYEGGLKNLKEVLEKK